MTNAARIDPESPRPAFVMGLAYAMVAKNPSKAVEHFTDVVRREPGSGAALNDLAVLEVLTRRYAGVVGHFREALARAADPRPVADNVAWAVKLAGAAKANPAMARSRMPDKTLDELNALYRTITQDLKLKPADTVTGPIFLGPEGTVCTAMTLADVAKLFESGAVSVLRRSLGFVVAPGHVVCPRRVVLADDGAVLDAVTVELPSEPGRRRAATVVAAPENGDVALLECDGLAVDPLPLAKSIPPAWPEVAVVDRADDSWLVPRPTAVRGRVFAPLPEAQLRGRFLHSAVVPRGPGGGPIVDSAGHVVGMVAPTPRTDESGNTAGFGVAVERILQVIGEHISPAQAGTGGQGASSNGQAILATVVVSRGERRPAEGP